MTNVYFVQKDQESWWPSDREASDRNLDEGQSFFTLNRLCYLVDMWTIELINISIVMVIKEIYKKKKLRIDVSKCN